MDPIYTRCVCLMIAIVVVACSAESSSPGPTVDASTSATSDAQGDAGPSVEADTAATPIDDADDTQGSEDATPSPDSGVQNADVGAEETQPPAVDPTDVTGGEEASGWPSNPDKDSIPDPGWDSVPAVGTVMPNFTATDQYGNQVELYDFAGQGVPVVIDVGTWFCEPCKALAAYLSDGDPSPFYEDNDDDGKVDFLWWNESYEIVYDLVNNGELIWITVLYSLGDPVTPEDAHLWHEEWPHPLIPVLADEALQLQEYLDVGAMPRIDVLNEDMVFEVFETKGPSTGMKYISALP